MMDNIERILSICLNIYHRADNAKANRERCQRVAQRVRALEGLVIAIKEKGPAQISPTVHQALNELCDTLKSAEQLMMKFNKTNSFEGFVKSNSHEEKFSKMNDKLSDNFQILSGALQIEQREMLYHMFYSLSVRGVNEGNDIGQVCRSTTAPLTFPMLEPPPAAPMLFHVPRPSPSIPMLPQTPQFNPTGPLPPQTQQFIPTTHLPTQSPQFRPTASYPPQTPVLSPTTPQFRPTAAWAPQTPQFRHTAPYPPQTPEFNPTTPQFRPTAALPLQRPQFSHTTPQLRPTAPLPPQTPQFRPTAPLPPQTPQFRSTAPLPPQTPQFRPTATLPPQRPQLSPTTLQLRPTPPLPPQTPQWRPTAPLSPQTPQFRSTPPLPPHTPQFIPITPILPSTIQMSNPTTAVPVRQILPPKPVPISTVSHRFSAAVPANVLSKNTSFQLCVPGNFTPTSIPASMNINAHNTPVVTHYVVSNPPLQLFTETV